jgi:hypothetical protein
MREKWPRDVDAAYEYLIAQTGVDPCGWASCGVSQSPGPAARHQEIKALVPVSGSASHAAKAYTAATPTLPVSGAASAGDWRFRGGNL